MSSNLPSVSLAAPMLKWPGFEVPLPVVSKLTFSGRGGLSPGCAGAGQRVTAAGLRGDGATALLPPCTHPAKRVPSLGHRLSPSRWRELLAEPRCTCTAPRAAAATLAPGTLSCSSCARRSP